MTNEKEVPEGYIKKGTVVWIAGAALAVGFLMGVVFSAYKSPQELPIKSSMPVSQPAAVAEHGGLHGAFLGGDLVGRAPQFA